MISTPPDTDLYESTRHEMENLFPSTGVEFSSRWSAAFQQRKFATSSKFQLNTKFVVALGGGSFPASHDASKDSRYGSLFEAAGLQPRRNWQQSVKATEARRSARNRLTAQVILVESCNPLWKDSRMKDPLSQSLRPMDGYQKWGRMPQTNFRKKGCN